MKPKIDSLESKRLLLEIREESHAAELYPLYCEKDLYHYTTRDIPISIDWLAGQFKLTKSLVSPDGKAIWLTWIGRDKATQIPVGAFEMTVVNNEAFIGYTIFKSFWGKGMAVEAVQTILEYMNTHYNIPRFIIEMDTRNRASIRVAEKVGFEFVKVKNNAAFIKNFVSHEFQFQKLN